MCASVCVYEAIDEAQQIATRIFLIHFNRYSVRTECRIFGVCADGAFSEFLLRSIRFKFIRTYDVLWCVKFCWRDKKQLLETSSPPPPLQPHHQFVEFSPNIIKLQLRPWSLWPIIFYYEYGHCIIHQGETNLLHRKGVSMLLKFCPYWVWVFVIRLQLPKHKHTEEKPKNRKVFWRAFFSLEWCGQNEKSKMCNLALMFCNHHGPTRLVARSSDTAYECVLDCVCNVTPQYVRAWMHFVIKCKAVSNVCGLWRRNCVCRKFYCDKDNNNS